MGLFHSLHGILDLEFVTADVSALLTKLNEENISINNLRLIDDLTIRVSVLRSDYKRLLDVAKRRGDKLTVIGKKGIFWRYRRLTERPIIVTAIAVVCILTLFLQNRILIVNVQGNSTVPSKRIIECADQCGISIFASRRRVRSEKVKNALLESIPELQWVGVNTAGCVATIHITEKTVQEDSKNKGVISSIVALRDGVILDCTVLQGNQLCQVGQAVKAGETLVSGYTDCGIFIKSTKSVAEIYGQTLRQLEMISPSVMKKREEPTDQKTNYGILFGKKLIKLYKGSGISDTTCVKIYDEIQLTLPGGYVLPISLIRETISEYSLADGIRSEDSRWLIDKATQYLQSQMIAGKIYNQKIQTTQYDDFITLSGAFDCVELIGKERQENIIQR